MAGRLRPVRRIEGLEKLPAWKGGLLPGGSAARTPQERRLQTMQFNVMERNLSNIMDVSTPAEVRAGEEWYPKAHEAARRIGLLAGANRNEAVHIGAGIISIQSPMTGWDENLVEAHHIATTGENLTPRVGSGVRLKRTRDWLDDPSQPVSKGGPKTRDFHANISVPDDPHVVTIDRHAHDATTGWSISGEERGIDTRNRRYTNLQRMYRDIGAAKGVRPSVAQAQVWGTYKRLKGDRNMGKTFHEHLAETQQLDQWESL